MFVDSDRVLLDEQGTTRVVFDRSLLFKTSVRKDSYGNYTTKVFKITIERAGTPLGSSEINIGPVLNDVFGKNSLIAEVRRELEFDDVDAYIEVMIRPIQKGRCETPTTKLSSSSRPPLQNSPPSCKPDIP